MGACNRKQELFPPESIHRIQYELLKSVDGYDRIPIVTLEQAAMPLVPILPQIQMYVRMVKEKCECPADGLTPDQSASIMLYSVAWQPSNECLYAVLNDTLRVINRQNLKPWFLYLKLLFTAVSNLPSKHLTVYRSSPSTLVEQYENDKIIIWWDFALCKNSMEHLQFEKCIDNIEARTIFTVESEAVKDISKHSYVPTDNSFMILPGTQFKVIECLKQSNSFHLISLQEMQSSFLLQSQTPSVKSEKFSSKCWSNNRKSRRLLKKSKTPKLALGYRGSPLDQLIIESGHGWIVDLDERNINDQDMKTIVKHAIIKNRCKRIRLRDNNITSLGAMKLAEGLNNNKSLESLDLRNNYISDLGVKSLASSIVNSNIKTLNLESNGITVEGAQYLALMLKNNQNLTELYLSNNHLSDQGLELITNVLIDSKESHHDQENKGVYKPNMSNLQHLYVGHNAITDVGIEHLADMLKKNRMITWLWLSGNKIGNRGVDLLANALAYYNSSLEWLFLNSNEAISDSCVDALILMLKRNHSLKTLYINNCSLSDIAKKKIQEVTKSKTDFDLEV